MANVLIVDDEAHNRLLIATVLSSVGHVVLEAATATEALSLTQANELDLIIVDLSLPDMSGTQLIQALRAETDSRSAVLLYSASDLSPAMEDFMASMNIKGAIPKPSEPEAILRLVSAALT